MESNCKSLILRLFVLTNKCCVLNMLQVRNYILHFVPKDRESIFFGIILIN